MKCPGIYHNSSNVIILDYFLLSFSLELNNPKDWANHVCKTPAIFIILIKLLMSSGWFPGHVQKYTGVCLIIYLVT